MRQRQIDRHGQYVQLVLEPRCALYRVAAFCLVTQGAAGELHAGTETQIQVFAEPQVGHKTHMKARQDATHPAVIDLGRSCHRVSYRYLAVGHEETGEVHSQLKTEMEQLVVYIRPVHRFLSIGS